MPYRKDPMIVSVVWGRIGAAVLGLLAFILGYLGYSMSPEEVETAYTLIGSILAGVAGVLALISKIRETKKAED